MTDKKKKLKKKPDGRGQRPRDPNQLAAWIVEQSTSGAVQHEQRQKRDRSTK